jgi:hypothetical protein
MSFIILSFFVCLTFLVGFCNLCAIAFGLAPADSTESAGAAASLTLSSLCMFSHQIVQHLIDIIYSC